MTRNFGEPLGERVALPTMHGKEHQIAPAFSEILGWQIELATVDTDQFGTFTGDVPRNQSPRETALAKARLGARESGLSKAVASEGSVSSHPLLPAAVVDRELIAFIDVQEGWEVVEAFVSTDIHAVSFEWPCNLSTSQIAARADLPAHALIVSTTTATKPLIRKGIRTLEHLELAIDECLAADPVGRLQIQSDLRAMMSPSRQAVIQQCARKIAMRLARRCSECEARGWGVVDHDYGVECSDCGTSSMNHIRADIEGCVRCDHREVIMRPFSKIDPAQCDICNP